MGASKLRDVRPVVGPCGPVKPLSQIAHQQDVLGGVYERFLKPLRTLAFRERPLTAPFLRPGVARSVPPRFFLPPLLTPLLRVLVAAAPFLRPVRGLEAWVSPPFLPKLSIGGSIGPPAGGATAAENKRRSMHRKSSSA